jgi:hypothetical protein
MNQLNELLVLSYELALEKEQESNRSSWDMYGSELCAGDMFRKEDTLRDKIKKYSEVLF